MEFDITVSPVPDVKVWTVEPDFMVGLQDQRVQVGDSLVYTLDNIEGSYGYQMDVTMRTGAASLFSSYDKTLKTFKVNGDVVTRENIGFYPIEVTATFFNSTFSETYKRQFILEVWDDPIPEEPKEPWFPEDPIWYPELPDYRYIRKNYTQEYDPQRPIPYIADLNEDGILKIGWNKVMSPPANHTEIPPTYIALEPDVELEGYRFWETRGREMRSYEDFEVLKKEPNIVYFADEVSRTYELM